MSPTAITKKPKSIDLRGRRRLSVGQLEAIHQVGRHPLDDLLYFTVQKNGTRGYELRFISPETGKRRDMTIGRFPEIDPILARERAAQARGLIARGIDPLEQRRREASRVQDATESDAFTLRVALREHFDIESARWRNEKYKTQWLDRMNGAFGQLLDRRLSEISKRELHDLLVKLNHDSHDSAIKALANLNKVYRRFSGTHGIPEAHNPAAAMVGLLPRTKPVRHHPAMDWRDAPSFVARLRDSSAWISVRLGFEWLISSGARTNAVTHARWDQIDLEDGCWHADPGEAANKRRGDVPLTPRMREILRAMEPHRLEGCVWLFPSAQKKTRSKKRHENGHPPISNEAFRQVLVRFGLKVTGHGFRSTFKTWAMESPQGRSLRLPEAILEAAIGHSEENAIKAAYTRADYWDMRVALADAWHDYLYVTCPKQS